MRQWTECRSVAQCVYCGGEDTVIFTRSPTNADWDVITSAAITAGRNSSLRDGHRHPRNGNVFGRVCLSICVSRPGGVRKKTSFSLLTRSGPGNEVRHRSRKQMWYGTLQALGWELIAVSWQSALRWYYIIVTNPVVGCHYFPPGPRLLSQPKRSPPPCWPVPNYTAWWQRHT